MKKFTVQAEIYRAAHIDELPEADAQLLLQAKAAAQNAYAPYSQFKVGAAVRLTNGEVVIGNNQENAAYPVTLCAERVAVFAASAQYPNVPIEAIAITVATADGTVDRPVPPCGSCRQVLYEYESRDDAPIRLILQGDKGEIYCTNDVKSLLPLMFDSSFL